MKINITCPLCRVGKLETLMSKEFVSVMGKFVDLEYSVCNVCKEEIILTDQIKRNDLLYLESTNENYNSGQ